ncbi:hypothetical protein J3R30DRAFT_3503631 [Lentinula aciculospora]|uniref:Nephrocystin 3-like N-terminal domain-containing protein n=1 Tax=Lentinula aciculospora TaxID=153920 RepID=A0A9W9A5H9_9AGAR|nr:hypothetical protein J3R30DRAFT_3503631 [Lentinula aciculospora]
MINNSFTIYGGQFTAISSDEHTKILSWLNAPDCSHTYVAAASKKTAGTGQRIYDLAEYKKWKFQPSVLWIQGQVGTGKTVLTTTIIGDLCHVMKQSFYYYFLLLLFLFSFIYLPNH